MTCEEIILGRAGIAVVREKFARSGFGVWPRRCTVIAAMAALVLLPIEASDAGWLSDVFKGSSKHGKSPKHHVASRKPAQLAAKHARLAKAPHHKACRPGAGQP